VVFSPGSRNPKKDAASSGAREGRPSMGVLLTTLAALLLVIGSASSGALAA
jgi:hypothetical protein